MIENELEQVVEILGNSSSYAIAEYAKWYFLSGIIWSSVWLVAIIATIKIKWESYIAEDSVFPLKFALFSLFSLALVSCIVNIFVPEAYAIHALIGDLR